MEQLFPVRRDQLDPLSIYDELEMPADGGERPFVAVNMVTSIDGKITFDLNERKAPIGSPVDRALMGRLRVHFDAVMRGAETVRANPYPPGVPDTKVEARLASGRSPQPLAVVVTRTLNLPWESAFFNDPERVVVFTGGGADLSAVPRPLQSRVEPVGTDGVDLVAALKTLREKYGVRRLLCEGGAALNYHMMRAGLMDEIYWTLAPKVSGFQRDLTMIEGSEMIRPTPRLSLVSLYHHQDELFHRWSVVRGDA